MATDLAEDTEIEAPEGQAGPEDETPQKSGIQLSAQKVKVVVLLLIVMAVQMAVGYMLLPEPAVSSMSETDEVADTLDDDSELNSVDTAEVPLGSYNPTNSRGSAGAVMHVSFNLTAIVATNNKAKLETAFKQTHGARIRAAVIRVIRSSNLEDLNDPDFNVIKRKLRETINKTLQETWINEVVLDQIRLMPQ